MTSTAWTGPERRETGRLHGRTATEITGPLQPPADRVRFRQVLSHGQHRRVLAMAWAHMALAVGEGPLPGRGRAPPQPRHVAAWNTGSGPFRARTEHGDHNSWRAEHEHRYDVVAQMDPDHVPFPNFLERTLGYSKTTPTPPSSSPSRCTATSRSPSWRAARPSSPTCSTASSSGAATATTPRC